MIWHIWTIIGIVLLCAAAFAAAVVLLVLFVPFRYRIKADVKDKYINAAAKVKWLLGFAAAEVSYEEAVSYKVKILFIPVLKGTIGEKEEKELTKKQRKKLEKKALKKAKKKEEKDKKANGKKAVNEAVKAEDKERSLKEKLLPAAEKLKKFIERLKTVKYIWDAPVTKRALSYAKEIIFKLLNHIRPKKIKGHIVFDLNDPSSTAQIYAAASVLTAPFADELILEPDFEGDKGFKAENIDISGRIFAGYMLLLALKVLKNKDIKRVVKYIRRNL